MRELPEIPAPKEVVEKARETVEKIAEIPETLLGLGPTILGDIRRKIKEAIEPVARKGEELLPK